LAAPGRRDFRPLTGRLRQSLFARLGERVRGASVLDLFAGAGVFGIEALSRGAARATFVEVDRTLVDAIYASIRKLGLEDESRVYTESVEGYLSFTRPGEPYDIVFLDPPYGRGLVFRTVEQLAAWPGFGGDTLGVAKAFKKEHFAGPPPLYLIEERLVGDDNLIFFGRK
jgi:16S rRNA (guanine966-N2)-methyltransferase